MPTVGGARNRVCGINHVVANTIVRVLCDLSVRDAFDWSHKQSLIIPCVCGVKLLFLNNKITSEIKLFSVSKSHIFDQYFV